MGVMIDGEWYAEEPKPTDDDGRYRRQDSVLRDWVTSDGGPGPDGQRGFKAEAGRYHLFVSQSCPWAHRTWIFRILKGLEAVVPMSLVVPMRDQRGWVFDNGAAQYRDDVGGREALNEYYRLGRSDYSGRVTVPVLWDTQSETIVSNESSEIIRMFNSAFDGITGDAGDFCPEALRGEIDAVNARTYRDLNNGVYRAGFARTQGAYEEAFDEVFACLDWMEERLAGSRYLCGDAPTEADWRAFPTLMRFDVAYVGAFKCNKRRLIDYPNLWGYARELYQWPGIAVTVFPDIYKRNYHSASAERNPLGIFPKGPEIDFSSPHGRDATGRRAAE
jgi:glutathionyl-hydroquinone reductase